MEEMCSPLVEVRGMKEASRYVPDHLGFAFARIFLWISGQVGAAPRLLKNCLSRTRTMEERSCLVEGGAAGGSWGCDHSILET